MMWLCTVADLILHSIGHDCGVLVVLLDEPLVLLVRLADLVLQRGDQLILPFQQRAAALLLAKDLGEEVRRTLSINIEKSIVKKFMRT